MIKATLDGQIIFYWQNPEIMPFPGDWIHYEGKVYEIGRRVFIGPDIELILKIV